MLVADYEPFIHEVPQYSGTPTKNKVSPIRPAVIICASVVDNDGEHSRFLIDAFSSTVCVVSSSSFFAASFWGLTNA